MYKSHLSKFQDDHEDRDEEGIGDDHATHQKSLPVINLSIIVLAAGKGSRMHSDIPKVLHQIAGQPLLWYILQVIENFCSQKFIEINDQNYQLNTKRVVLVVSNDLIEDRVFQELQNRFEFEVVLQKKRDGTGDAVRVAVQYIENSKGNYRVRSSQTKSQKENHDAVYDLELMQDDDGMTQPMDAALILYGDTPFITVETISQMVINKFTKFANDAEIFEKDESPDIICLGFKPKNPQGYGCFLISDAENKQLLGILEDKESDVENFSFLSDASEIKDLYNSGIKIADYNLLKEFVLNSQLLEDALAQEKEFYLTDLVNYATQKNRVSMYLEVLENEAMGINNLQQKAEAEVVMQQKLRLQAMAKGVTLIASDTVFFNADTKIGKGTVIHPYVCFGANVVIKDNVNILPFSHIEGAQVEKNTTIGPFARIRGNTKINADCYVGNFCEVKNSVLESGVKSGHFSYLGDVQIGMQSNIGAGVVFCNYDGQKKHRSVVGAKTFVGSNSSIISPVRIGESAFVAAGTVVTEDVEDSEFVIARVKQRNMRSTKNTNVRVKDGNTQVRGRKKNDKETA